MNNIILHKASTRGHADHGWLESFQSFSFANYYNPDRIQFGTLRVLNDDRVDGGKGFGSHPHDNMEIISIPLEGSLVHEDNLGNRKTVGKGEVQVMSTGSGVFHSEYNNEPDKAAKFLQIWVYPNRLNVTPRYAQIKRDSAREKNRLQAIISPDQNAAEGTWVYQDAWFEIGHFDEGKQFTYRLKQPGNGLYIFVIGGSFSVCTAENSPKNDEQILEARDGLGVTESDSVGLTPLTADAEVLLMEIPMQNKIR